MLFTQGGNVTRDPICYIINILLRHANVQIEVQLEDFWFLFVLRTVNVPSIFDVCQMVDV